MNRRSVSACARSGGFAIVLAAGCVGLWQCARDVTTGAPGQITLRLRAAAESSRARYESLDIEVTGPGGYRTRETTTADAHGDWNVLLPVPSGGPYVARVYAWGQGCALPPDSMLYGVIAAGSSDEFEIEPYQTADVTITLHSTAATGLRIRGQPGVSSVSGTWSPVSEATSYVLAWYARGGVATGASAPVTDTSATIEWSGPLRLAVLGGEPESVLFRVQPNFGSRAGVYGESLWVDLSMWLDPIRLESFEPRAGQVLAADTAHIIARFDRAVDTTSIGAGIHWTSEPDGTPVFFAIDCPPESGDRVCILHPRAELTMGADYRVTIDEDLIDKLGRPFDSDSMASGLQPFQVDWRTAPYDPLRVAMTLPAGGDTGVARAPVIMIALNREALPASVEDSTVMLADSSETALAASIELSPARDTIILAPIELLWYSSEYTIHVLCGVADARGKPLDQNPGTYTELEPFAATFRTRAQPVGPRVVSMWPSAGTEAVPRDAVVRVEFSTAVDPASVRHYDTFQLLCDGTVGIGGAITHDEAGRVFTFTPGAPLHFETDYEVYLRATFESGDFGIVDLEGLPLDQDRRAPGYQDFAAWFATESPPRVASVRFTPEDADTLVDVEPTIRLVFTRALDPATLNTQAIAIRHEGASVPGAISAPSDSIVDVRPLAPLAFRHDYSVRVDTLVADRNGSLLDQSREQAGRQPFERFFHTEPESIHPQVVVVLPHDGDTLVGSESAIRLGFSRAIDPATAPGAISLTRTSGQGAPQAVLGDVQADSLAAAFTPGASLETLTDYEVRVSCGLLSRDGLPLDQETDEAGLQPFRSAFRTDRERVSPNVVQISPGDGEEDVPIDARIVVVFSEPMSLSVADAFHLLRGERQVAGAGELADDRVAFRFVPADSLEWLAGYSIVVDTTATDLAGNPLDGYPDTPSADPFVSTFTTERDRVGPYLVWTDPENGATSVPVDASVRAGFSEALASSLPAGGFRVLDPAGNALPGRLVRGPDSVLVWTPVSLPDSLPTTLAFDAEYGVVADTSLTDPWGNRFDDDPIQTGAQPYRGFFTTMEETLAPRVVDFLPTTVDIPLDAHPALVFSEAMNVLSLQGESVVRLLEVGGSPLDFALDVCASGDTVTLVPERSFEFDHEYEITVDTLAADLGGNRLDQDESLPGRQPYSVVFRTRFDLLSPSVIEVVPADSARHVDPATQVRIRFSEPIDASSVDEESVVLSGPGGGVALSAPPWLEADSLAVLDPADTLDFGAEYTVVATPQVRDVAGNPLDQDPDTPGAQEFVSRFTIGRPPVIAWDAPLCDWADSARVQIDASGSADPDSDDEVELAIWDWGDGAVDSLSGPNLLMGDHDYGALDTRGCNGVDDDGDGVADEQEGMGPSPCDESYRVRLRLIDAHEFAAEAVAGVSFCAFVADSSDPLAGGSLLPADSLRIWFTRDVDPAGMDSSVAVMRMPDSTIVPIDLALETPDRIRVAPRDSLPAGDYVLRVETTLRDVRGARFDHDPAASGRQPFDLPFRVIARRR